MDRKNTYLFLATITAFIDTLTNLCIGSLAVKIVKIANERNSPSMFLFLQQVSYTFKANCSRTIGVLENVNLSPKNYPQALQIQTYSCLVIERTWCQ